MNSSLLIVKHQTEVATELLEILDRYFTENEEYYVSMETEDFRELVLQAQSEMNDRYLGDAIANDILPSLQAFLETTDILIQSNIYLRAARPESSSLEESIGWHRESFYGKNMGSAVNIWTPLRGVSKKNTIRYIPGSEAISDKDIVTSDIHSPLTKEFSAGHKLGFLYKPKKIVSGVDLSAGRPLVVREGSSAIFDGNIIHGAAINKTPNIRFTVDFRAIAARHYSADNKRFHFASGKSYFKKLD